MRYPQFMATESMQLKNSAMSPMLTAACPRKFPPVRLSNDPGLNPSQGGKQAFAPINIVRTAFRIETLIPRALQVGSDGSSSASA